MTEQEKQEAINKVKPICADCKHYDVINEWSGPVCSRAVASVCNVTGVIRYRACHDERNRGYQGSCGTLGKFFEQYVAPTWLDKLIALFK